MVRLRRLSPMRMSSDHPGRLLEEQGEGVNGHSRIVRDLVPRNRSSGSHRDKSDTSGLPARHSSDQSFCTSITFCGQK